MSAKTSEQPETEQCRRAVHCPKCRRFLFNIVVTAEKPYTGPIGRISDFKCRCGHVSMVLMGVGNADKRKESERVEEALRKQMLEEQ